MEARRQQCKAAQSVKIQRFQKPTGLYVVNCLSAKENDHNQNHMPFKALYLQLAQLADMSEKH